MASPQGIGAAKSYHHPDLRRSLLDGALVLLREEGTRGFSLRKLAARVGVSHAAPYRHFANKDELLAAITLEGHRRLAALLTATLAEKAGAPGAERLLALGRAYLRFARENSGHLAVMFSGDGSRAATILLGPSDKAGEEEGSGGVDSFAPLEATVRECQESGVLASNFDPAVVAMAYWSQMHGLALLANERILAGMARETGAGEEEVLEAILSYIASGFGGGQPSGAGD